MKKMTKKYHQQIRSTKIEKPTAHINFNKRNANGNDQLDWRAILRTSTSMISTYLRKFQCKILYQKYIIF